jgi:pimeloyl-ACP methyl ester carboxylesterase
MFLLAPRLQKLLPETHVHVFEYPSRRLTLAEMAHRLADFVSAKSKGESTSFVGHSLGGLVVRALDAMPAHPSPLSRLVTLGTPHQGARIAALVARVPVLASLGGPVLHDLHTPPLPAQPRSLQVGCVIGHTTTRFGYLPFLGQDNDGLVCVEEAIFPACAAEFRTFTFHGLFPFVKRTAKLSAHFLEHGSFECQQTGKSALP